MKHLSKYIVFFILIIIIFILLKEYKVIKIFESYKSGICEVEKTSFGEYSVEYKKCILNRSCKSNGDCGNDENHPHAIQKPKIIEFKKLNKRNLVKD